MVSFYEFDYQIHIGTYYLDVLILYRTYFVLRLFEFVYSQIRPVGTHGYISSLDNCVYWVTVLKSLKVINPPRVGPKLSY